MPQEMESKLRAHFGSYFREVVYLDRYHTVEVVLSDGKSFLCTTFDRRGMSEQVALWPISRVEELFAQG